MTTPIPAIFASTSEDARPLGLRGTLCGRSVEASNGSLKAIPLTADSGNKPHVARIASPLLKGIGAKLEILATESFRITDDSESLGRRLRSDLTRHVPSLLPDDSVIQRLRLASEETCGGGDADEEVYPALSPWAAPSSSVGEEGFRLKRVGLELASADKFSVGDRSVRDSIPRGAPEEASSSFASAPLVLRPFSKITLAHTSDSSESDDPIGSNGWLRKICAAVEESCSVTYRGILYKSLSLLGSGQNNRVYILDETRVLRVLKSVQAHTSLGPSMHMLKNIYVQAKALTEAGLPVAAIENDPLREGFIVQKRIQGHALEALSDLKEANMLKAQILKAFIEFGLKNKIVVDLQLSNFIVDETSDLPVLVDFYEESQDSDDDFENVDVVLEQQRMLLNFLPKVCGNPAVGRFLTSNLMTLNFAIYTHLKEKGLGAYLPD